MNEARVIIFSTVWPEPHSSAGGVRQMQWVHLFLAMGYQITLVCPARMKTNTDWGALEMPKGVELLSLPLNRESIVKDELIRLNPEIVMFDRFLLEEQYGPHVYAACPDALILMETVDLNFVRRARDELKDQFLTLESLPRDIYQTETALRETSSILRVDYSFVVSTFEEKLLRDEFQIGQEKVKWIPFFYEKPIEVKERRLPFSEKKGFCWIGNFRHEPNLDGIRWFRNEIWPLIRKQLPDARIKIYGSYPPKEVMDWNQAEKSGNKHGIEVKGNALTLDEVFTQARVNIASLRFGAGVKGKILEGFRYGVPCVSTSVGTEGLFPIPESERAAFPGIEANTAEAFAAACVKLHEDEKEWSQTSLMGLQKMMQVFSASAVVPDVIGLISDLLAKKKSKTIPNWMSRVMRFEGNQSRYYFAKWIEAKETKG